MTDGGGYCQQTVLTEGRPGRPSLRGPSLFVRASWCGVQNFNRRLHLRRNRLCILHVKPAGGGGSTTAHLQRLALDVVGVHRQQVKRIDERDRHDIGLRLDREKECARQERLNLSISRTAALRKDYQRHATAQAPQR